MITNLYIDKYNIKCVLINKIIIKMNTLKTFKYLNTLSAFNYLLSSHKFKLTMNYKYSKPNKRKLNLD